jgi:adenine phosphoribosyltransferase
MAKTLEERIRGVIRDVPDFPKSGILFRDITPVLLNPGLFEEAVEALWEPFHDQAPDSIGVIESRGFIMGSALALRHRRPLVLLRKPGKLPAETYKETYELEYGQDSLEMHRDAVRPGQRVLIVDDLLATGGTAAAACRLVLRAGGEVVGCSFLIELADLKGRRLVEPHPIHSIVTYGDSG